MEVQWLWLGGSGKVSCRGYGKLSTFCIALLLLRWMDERDAEFLSRSQGYELTLQQATKAIDGLGIVSLAKGIVSTRDVLHAN